MSGHLHSRAWLEEHRPADARVLCVYYWPDVDAGRREGWSITLRGTDRLRIATLAIAVKKMVDEDRAGGLAEAAFLLLGDRYTPAVGVELDEAIRLLRSRGAWWRAHPDGRPVTEWDKEWVKPEPDDRPSRSQAIEAVNNAAARALSAIELLEDKAARLSEPPETWANIRTKVGGAWQRCEESLNARGS